MTQQELEALGWEFDGEAPAQYGIRNKKDRTMWDWIVSKSVAEGWQSVRDIYDYMTDYKYKQGYANGVNRIRAMFKEVMGFTNKQIEP